MQHKYLSYSRTVCTLYSGTFNVYTTEYHQYHALNMPIELIRIITSRKENLRDNGYVCVPCTYIVRVYVQYLPYKYIVCDAVFIYFFLVGLTALVWCLRCGKLMFNL